MSKAVLMSIQPKWCELIASGKKTIEVRKTSPNIETPFKVYIYCTKDNFKSIFQTKQFLMHNRQICNAKVVGEFICDNITRLVQVGFTGNKDVEYRAVTNNGTLLGDDIFDFACLDKKDINTYLGGKVGYAWNITKLVIYDEPKELSEFITPTACDSHIAKHILCNTCCLSAKFCSKKPKRITRPPQSWCYVEELSD